MYTTILIASVALFSATADWAQKESLVCVANDAAECCSTTCCDGSACASSACCDGAACEAACK